MMYGEIANDKKEIAHMFNNFFTNVGIKLANDITVPSEYKLKDCLHSEITTA